MEKNDQKKKTIENGHEPTLAPMPPSIGRIVHYVPSSQEKGMYNGGGEIAAAIVVNVDGMTCNLVVFFDHDETARLTSVKYNDDLTQERSWHWPPRV